MRITVYDDDPDSGPPRLMTYEVLNINRGGVSLIGDYHTQKMHTLDALRSQGHGEIDIAGPKIPCRTAGCPNRASERNPVCSSCRGKVRARCACGRVRSRDAVRCNYCTTLNRRLKKVRLWKTRV